MFDHYTYVVYISLLFTLMILTINTGNCRDINYGFAYRLKIKNIFGLLLISFIVGFRYNVGVDWQGYVDDFHFFEENHSLSYSEQYWEYGYYIINKTIAVLGLSYEWVFFVIALLSWYFIFKSVHACLLPILPLLSHSFR
ncbi:MAG: EpsG family protein [Desulfuromonadales bacterium]